MPKLYYRISDPQDVRAIEDLIIAWQEAGNPKAELWALQPDKPSEDAIWSNGSWIIPEPPTYTAEDWIQDQGFTSLQIQALTRLEANILNSGKVLGPIMVAVKSWLEGIMFESALNPVPKNNWPLAPATYIQASQEAAQTLSN